ncbi:MAG: hypothetical protein DLM64_14730 [Solirubrobacterales bacterium]|nr:MAG: hypothetical protein DLM64_14730 [Solirubrobacterales bacterium]
MLATLGAPERRRRIMPRKQLQARAEPEPVPVCTGRATIVDVREPFESVAGARAWLEGAGEDRLAADLAVLNRALHAFRLATADPYLNAVGRRQALVARIGFGGGEQVADGRWCDARELVAPRRRARRSKLLQPQARLAAVLSGRMRTLVCEELALRARLDLAHGREREAALQVQVALDAAQAELASDPAAGALAARLAQLRDQHGAVAAAARTAVAGPLCDSDRELVEFTLARIEAALRARAAEG